MAERENGMNDTTPIRGGQSRRDQAEDERLEILRMVESGTITADEAARLLDALGDAERAAPAPPPRPGRGRQVRIRVSDSATGKAKVNLVLPIGLIDAGLGIAQRFAPERFVDSATIREALSSGVSGPLLDVDDKGERVEIIVE
jgi:hypothetical protein